MFRRFFRAAKGPRRTPAPRPRARLLVEALEERSLLDVGLASLSTPPFGKIVAFGDSLTDTGNVFAATGGQIPQSPPYFEGRFSNGPQWVEYLADALSIPRPEPALVGLVGGIPSFGSGTNFAFGNAETGSGFSTDGGVPNVGTQIQLFFQAGHRLNGTELVTVWAGGNDFLRGGQLRPWIPVRNLADHITTLAHAGARTILVPNLPPIGLLPTVRNQPLKSLLLNLQTVAFNKLLDSTLTQLDRSLRHTQIIKLDVFTQVVQGMSNPDAFGFTNITDTALRPDGTVVPNPDEYFFWDPAHPTTRAHELIGLFAAQTVMTQTASLSAPVGQASSQTFIWTVTPPAPSNPANVLPPAAVFQQGPAGTGKPQGLPASINAHDNAFTTLTFDPLTPGNHR